MSLRRSRNTPPTRQKSSAPARSLVYTRRSSSQVISSPSPSATKFRPTVDCFPSPPAASVSTKLSSPERASASTSMLMSYRTSRPSSRT
jgi:hypothetical protein